MRIVVDTNIAFSAILNTDSKIGTILLQPKSRLNFYSTDQLLSEIKEHSDKLLKLTKKSESELNTSINLITRRIRFINPQIIPSQIFTEASELTSGVDIDGCEFVALTEHIKGRFWSGDKELINGLILKKWNRFIDTNELYRLIK